jgi:hypothetical protein
VLQIFRVSIAFEAQQLRREPLWMEKFIPGDLLIVLGEENSYINFCRYDESTVLDERDQFTIAAPEFEQSTEKF